jgi:GT2 family glycosyltransferase
MGAEERELCDRWQHNGGRMMYAPEVLVYHFHALTFRSFLRQHYKYGCGAFHFHRLRSARKWKRIKVEPLTFYYNLIMYPFLGQEGWRAPLLLILLIFSQAANAVGFFMEKFKQ